MIIERMHGTNANAYGEIVSLQEDGREIPVICGCGGSMWLCRKCRNVILSGGEHEKETT